MPTFLLGAGFNVDAAIEARPIFGDYERRYKMDCSYPLVDDTLGPCFGLAKLPEGKSLEDLFSDALERKDYAPLKKLAKRLMDADHYLALRLTTNVASNSYREFFHTFERSNFLTFNYDSLPETFLFHLRRWYPHDGYGVPVNINEPIPWLENFADKHSTSLVLHLHGTLCVRTSEFEIRREAGDTMALLKVREHAAYEFDPADISENFAPFRHVAGENDVRDQIIAPVPNKSLKELPFIVDSYARAIDFVCDSGTIIAIGYSFNAHDGNSYQQLLQALSESEDRRLVIVSLDADAVAEKLRSNFPCLRIEPFNVTFKQWVAALFPGVNPTRQRTPPVTR